MQRSLIHAFLALLLVPATVATVFRMMPEPVTSVLAFPKPTHRVAVAVEGVMKSDLTSVQRGQVALGFDASFKKPNGQRPSNGEVVIPEDYPAFWYDLGAPRSLDLTTLNTMELEAKAQDGRTVRVTITDDPTGKGSLVDFHGDDEMAKALLAKIADRLAHPPFDHESPEDRAALIAFFHGKPNPPASPATLDPAVSQAAGPGQNIHNLGTGLR